jgi:predicted ArsR family transcriptional regulator
VPLTVTVDVPPRDREVLESWLRASSIRAGLAQRARIVLLAADGVRLDRIARELGVQRNVVRTWVDRYGAAGLAGLQDRPRSGRPRTFSP